MIEKNKIKDIVFSNYNEYIRIACEKHSYLKKIGISPEELVNESIVGIIDCRIKFQDEQSIHDFIKKAINSVAYVELADSKSKRIGSSDDEYTSIVMEGSTEEVFEYGDSIYAERASSLYDLFYEYRFPNGLE